GRTWIERSRSGNAHVWVFFSEPCPAWAARGILSAATESLGRPDVEVFPKQDELRLDIDGRQPLGNYINLPYFGRTERPMIRPGASDYTFAEFVSAAWEQRTDP